MLINFILGLRHVFRIRLKLNFKCDSNKINKADENKTSVFVTSHSIKMFYHNLIVKSKVILVLQLVHLNSFFLTFVLVFYYFCHFSLNVKSAKNKYIKSLNMFPKEKNLTYSVYTRLS